MGSSSEFACTIKDLPEPTSQMARDYYNLAQKKEGGLFMMFAWKLFGLFSSSYSAALKLYKESIAIEPGCAKVHTALGILLARMGHFDEALNHLQEAKKASPNNAWVLANLGQCYREMKKYDEANEYYRRAERELLERKGDISLGKEEISLLRKNWGHATQITVYLDMLEKSPSLTVRLRALDIEHFASGIEKRLLSQAELDISLPINPPLDSPSIKFEEISRIVNYLKRRVGEVKYQ